LSDQKADQDPKSHDGAVEMRVEHNCYNDYKNYMASCGEEQAVIQLMWKGGERDG
jgi:hypothetical protein